MPDGKKRCSPRRRRRGIRFWNPSLRGGGQGEGSCEVAWKMLRGASPKQSVLVKGCTSDVEIASNKNANGRCRVLQGQKRMSLRMSF